MSKSILSLVQSRLQQEREKWEKRRLNVGEKIRVWAKRVAFFGIGMGLMGGLTLVGVLYYLEDRALPGVTVLGKDVSLMPRGAIELLVRDEAEVYLNNLALEFEVEEKHWEKQVPRDKVEVEVQQTVNEAIDLKSQRTIVAKGLVLAQRLRNGKRVDLAIRLAADFESELVASLAAQIDRPYVPPTISVLPYPDLETSSRIRIDPGAPGQVLDEEMLIDRVHNSISKLETAPIRVPVKVQKSDISDGELDETRRLAEALLSRRLEIKYEGEADLLQAWVIETEDLVHFVEVGGGYSREKIADYLTEVAKVVDRKAQNARFTYEPETGRVGEFTAALPGLRVEVEASTEKLIRALAVLTEKEAVEPVELVVSQTEPEVTLDQVNDLGIKELLGRGVSTYYGSALSRVHNVALAAARVNGVVVKPGETFSFNEAVGEISKATGYQEAYVIFEGRTELGDGGGVCQDSTTMFRAALDAGLPIVERKPHSYRVGYYEQDTKKPGLDATVYPPYADLKFMNDTPAHLLIQSWADTPNRTLYYEIYGTSDGRVAEISNHTVWDISPPPPEVNIDDPTLPAGEVKQIENAIKGAKAKFDYKVIRGEEVLIEETFYSYYKPWAAVYLRGTSGQ